MTERGRRRTAVAVILWLLLVLAATYYVYKPVKAAQLLAIGRAAADLVVVGMMAAIAGALGLRLMGAERPAGRAETVAWSTGLGLGMVALAWLGLGAVGGFHAWLAWALLLLATIWLRRGILGWLRLIWEMRTQLWPAGRSRRVWQCYLLTAFGLALLLAWLPPTAWDALVYHLTGPKLYLEAHRLVHPLDLPYLGFPQLGEMLFTAAVLLRRPAAAQLVSLLYGGFLALGCYSLAGRRWGRTTGALAAAILFSAVTVLLLLSWPYVDVILMFYSLAAFAALDRALEHDSPRWQVIAGLFAGMAVGTKYTGGAVALGAILVALAAGGKDGRWRAVLRFSLAAGVMVAPWFVKNWVLTGNPLYPFFLPGRYWDGYRAWWYGRAGTGLAATAPWQILLAPWYATVWGIERGAGFDATIGPLFLALTPFALLTRRQQSPEGRSWLVRVVLYCLPAYLLWLIGISASAQLVQTRLLSPIFPLLALLGAGGLAPLDGQSPRGFRLGWVVRVVIAFVLLLNLVNLGLVAIRHRPLSQLVGLDSPEEYLTDRLGWHWVAVRALSELPGEPRVLFLWEPRSLYCRVECWPDSLLDRWWHARRTLGEAADIAAAWKAEGFTHLLLFDSGYRLILEQAYDPISEADQAALTALLGDEMVLQRDFGGVYSLYEFR